MGQWELTGRVVAGLGQARGFTGLDWVQRALRARLGIEPWPGTLNLRLDEASRAAWRQRRAEPGIRLPGQSGACDARCYPVEVVGGCAAAILVPEVPGYPEDQLELVAAVSLREHLGLGEDAALTVRGGSDSGHAAVLFDVDGTLINSVDAYHIAAGRAAAPLGYEVTRQMVRTALNSQQPLWELVIPDPTARDAALITRLRQETMRHWERVLEDHVTVFPGLSEMLQLLRAAGVRLGIYSGSRGESFAPLERAGLLGLFEVILTSHDVVRAKPHPEGVLRCLELMGVAPEAAAYVGDSVPDMVAARAAGARAIGMLTGAADSAALTAAGAQRLAADYGGLLHILLPDRPGG